MQLEFLLIGTMNSHIDKNVVRRIEKFNLIPLSYQLSVQCPILFALILHSLIVYVLLQQNSLESVNLLFYFFQLHDACTFQGIYIISLSIYYIP